MNLDADGVVRGVEVEDQELALAVQADPDPLRLNLGEHLCRLRGSYTPGVKAQLAAKR